MTPARRTPAGEGGFIDFGETPPGLDPAVSTLLNRTERRQAEAHLSPKERERKKKERDKMRARRDKHTTYDIPVALRQRIKTLAEKESVSASQVAALALLRLLNDLDSGALSLSAYKIASNSPRYDFNLQLPLEVLDRKPAKKGRP